MTKKFVVRIGYVTYAVEASDAVALLGIAARMKVVKQQNGYSGPYTIQTEDDPPLTSVELADIEEVPTEPTDKFTAATRDIAPF